MATTPRSTLVTKAQELMKSQGLSYADAAKQARATLTPTPTTGTSTTPTATTPVTTPVTQAPTTPPPLTPPPVQNELTKQDVLQSTKWITLEDRRNVMQNASAANVVDQTPTQTPTTPQPTPVTPATPVTTTEVKPTVTPTPTKVETPVDRATQINQNLTEGFNNNPALFQDRQAFDNAYSYNSKPPEEKAALDAFYKSKQPTINSYYDQLVAGTANPDSRNDPSYRVANMRYNKMKIYSWMSQTELKDSLKNGDIIEGSQEWEDVKKVNPKLAQDALNLFKVNGNKPTIFKTDSEGNKVNVLESNATDTWTSTFGDMFKVESLEEIRAKVQTPDFIAAQTKANELSQKLNGLQDELDAVEDQVKAEFEWTGATSSRIAMEVAKRTKELSKSYDSVNRAYTTQFNIANQILTQNTADLAIQQKQQDARNQAMYWIAMEQYKTQQALQLSQAQFEQKLAQQAQLAKDPVTWVQQILNTYAEIGILPQRSQQEIIADIEKQVAQGIPVETALTNLNKAFQSKPEYQQYMAYQKSKMTPQVDKTPFQAMSLWDWKAMLYNQSTGKYDIITWSVSSTNAPTTTSAKYLNIPTWTDVWVQCGTFARELCGLDATPGGNSLDARKKAYIEKSPVAWGMVLFTWNWYDQTYGHIAAIESVNQDWTMNIVESNLKWDNKVTRRTISVNDSAIYWFYNDTPLAKQWTQQQYTDSDIELLAELANMDASARNTALKAQWIPLKAVTDYMALAKAGKIPPTETQKQSATQIISGIQDIASMDWNDATGINLSMMSEAPAGSDWATAQAKIENLVASITLPNLGMLKWPMSDKDLAFIRNASSKLATTQSDAEFEKQLIELYNISARKAWLEEITKLSQIPKTRIIPWQSNTSVWSTNQATGNKTYTW